MHRTSKTTPCWYYNQEGRSCPQGSSCRFLHPNNPKGPRMLSSRFQDGRRRKGDSGSRTRRSAPLVPQSALFLLRKSEELSMDARERDIHHYSDGGTKRDHGDSESTGAGRKDIEKDSPASRGRQTNSETDNFGQEIIPKSNDDNKKLQRYSDTSRTQEIKLELKSNLHYDPQRPGQPKKQSRGPVGLFRDLARLSREVDTLSEVQRKEEGYTKTYKQISATLESISESAANTIAPQLSRSLEVQADCKKVIEEKEKIMQILWTDAVEALARDVTREVDVGLQAALLSIKQEARQAAHLTGRSHKRQRDEEGVEIKKTDSNTMILEHKRRRGASVDSSSDGLQDNKGSSLDEIED